MRFLRTDTSCRIGHLRARAAGEIAFVVLCVLIAEWAVIPIFGRRKSIGMIPILMVFLFGFLSHRVRGETAREIGFTGRNFGSAFRLLVVWMAPAAGTLLGVGWLVGSLHFNPPRDWAILVQRQLWLFLWALMQQYALQAIVNRRAQEIWGKGAPSIAAAALLFAALHLVIFWGTALGGITGMILAVPLTAFLVAVWTQAKAGLTRSMASEHDADRIEIFTGTEGPSTMKDLRDDPEHDRSTLPGPTSPGSPTRRRA